MCRYDSLQYFCWNSNFTVSDGCLAAGVCEETRQTLNDLLNRKLLFPVSAFYILNKGGKND